MEKWFQLFVAFFAGGLQYLFGEWSPLLGILVTFTILDFGSGMWASYLAGELKSKIGMIGITKKVFIFVMVAVAHLIDLFLIETGMETKAYIMTMTIVFYSVNEILSIIENAGRIGLPVPEQIKNAVVVLKGKDDKK